MRRLGLALAAVLVSTAGACELFFPFDVTVEAGSDARLGDGAEDAPGDADAMASFDGTLPTVLFYGAHNGYGLAGDDASLYWFQPSDGGGLRMMLTNKEDGGTQTLLANAGPNPSSIAVDDARIYWVTAIDNGYPYGGAVVTTAKDGGDFHVLASETNWWPSNIAVDDSNVYINNPYSSSQPVVSRVAKDGGALVPLELSSAYDNTPESIAVDDASVYRIHRSRISSYPKSCSLEAGTCVVHDLMIENNNTEYLARDMAVDDTGVYWVEYSSGGIYACGVWHTSKVGGADVDAATNLYASCGTGIALDSKWVYTMTEGTPLVILAAAKTGGGGAVTPVLPIPIPPIVADGVAIYWIDKTVGRIMKLVR